MVNAWYFLVLLTHSLWASAVDFSRFFLLIDGTGNLAKLVKESRSKTCLLSTYLLSTCLLSKSQTQLFFLKMIKRSCFIKIEVFKTVQIVLRTKTSHIGSFI